VIGGAVLDAADAVGVFELGIELDLVVLEPHDRRRAQDVAELDGALGQTRRGRDHGGAHAAP